MNKKPIKNINQLKPDQTVIDARVQVKDLESWFTRWEDIVVWLDEQAGPEHWHFVIDPNNSYIDHLICVDDPKIATLFGLKWS